MVDFSSPSSLSLRLEDFLAVVVFLVDFFPLVFLVVFLLVVVVLRFLVVEVDLRLVEVVFLLVVVEVVFLFLVVVDFFFGVFRFFLFEVVVVVVRLVRDDERGGVVMMTEAVWVADLLASTTARLIRIVCRVRGNTRLMGSLV